MEDEDESGQAPKRSQTLQIIRWVVVAILFTSAAWLLATYLRDFVGFR